MVLAGTGSAALLLAAFGFQALGFLPCTMCVWQRWPHVAAAALAVLGAIVPRAAFAGLGAAAMLGNAGLAAYHSGVERGWWEGPQACAAGGEDLGALSGADLLSVETAPPVVLCTDITWQVFGLTMANYNLAACIVLAGLWIAAARLRLPPGGPTPRTPGGI